MGIINSPVFMNLVEFFNADWMQNQFYAGAFIRLLTWMAVYLVWELGIYAWSKTTKSDMQDHAYRVGRKIGLVISLFTFLIPTEVLLWQTPFIVVILSWIIPAVLFFGLYKLLFSAFPSNNMVMKIFRVLMIIAAIILVNTWASAVRDGDFSYGGDSDQASQVVEQGAEYATWALAVLLIWAIINLFTGGGGSFSNPFGRRGGGGSAGDGSGGSTVRYIDSGDGARRDLDKERKKRKALEDQLRRLRESLEGIDNVDGRRLAWLEELGGMIGGGAVASAKGIKDLLKKLKKLDDEEMHLKDRGKKALKKIGSGLGRLFKWSKDRISKIDLSKRPSMDWLRRLGRRKTSRHEEGRPHEAEDDALEESEAATQDDITTKDNERHALVKVQDLSGNMIQAQTALEEVYDDDPLKKLKEDVEKAGNDYLIAVEKAAKKPNDINLQQDAKQKQEAFLASVRALQGAMQAQTNKRNSAKNALAAISQGVVTIAETQENTLPGLLDREKNDEKIIKADFKKIGKEDKTEYKDEEHYAQQTQQAIGNMSKFLVQKVIGQYGIIVNNGNPEKCLKTINELDGKFNELEKKLGEVKGKLEKGIKSEMPAQFKQMLSNIISILSNDYNKIQQVKANIPAMKTEYEKWNATPNDATAKQTAKAAGTNSMQVLNGISGELSQPPNGKLPNLQKFLSEVKAQANTDAQRQAA